MLFTPLKISLASPCKAEKLDKCSQVYIIQYLHNYLVNTANKSWMRFI